ncbi:hypothetical protein [Streptomyces spectabilis]|uniref:Uncharacterized protein n=1 Tax=Streptomyces spectabilis TaxID=68270 RepID=A0A516RI63_STRST|nr:hypothetical protein [Streptomyces spectabilis]QDQ15347.1 hypothetical protein FH965_36260 [Streptomyces spectabilis]
MHGHTETNYTAPRANSFITVAVPSPVCALGLRSTPREGHAEASAPDGVDGGGETRSAILDGGSDPLEGRLGLGVTVAKTDDHALRGKYGRKTIVTLQPTTDDVGADASPEFSGFSGFSGFSETIKD